MATLGELPCLPRMAKRTVPRRFDAAFRVSNGRWRAMWWEKGRRFLRSTVAKLSGVIAPLTRGMTLGVRGACIDGNGHVFLVRHTYTPGWYLPGGGVERGEDVGTALRRELVEEGGLTLRAEPILFGVYLNPRRSRDHIVLFVARSLEWSAVPPFPNNEIAEGGFFDPASPPADTTPATERRLREILDGHPTSPHW